jgi:hypothetical protein
MFTYQRQEWEHGLCVRKVEISREEAKTLLKAHDCGKGTLKRMEGSLDLHWTARSFGPILTLILDSDTTLMVTMT